MKLYLPVWHKHLLFVCMLLMSVFKTVGTGHENTVFYDASFPDLSF